jgi:hypothetical protein
MKRYFIAIAVLASMLLPVSAMASDRYHGSSHYSSRGHYDRGYRGGASFGFSFGFGAPRYYAPHSYYAPTYSYYRPVYRPYYPPPVYYYNDPVYVPAPYIAPVRRYYRDDCDYYYRPSINLSFGFGRYHYR